MLLPFHIHTPFPSPLPCPQSYSIFTHPFPCPHSMEKVLSEIRTDWTGLCVPDPPTNWPTDRYDIFTTNSEISTLDSELWILKSEILPTLALHSPPPPLPPPYTSTLTSTQTPHNTHNTHHNTHNNHQSHNRHHLHIHTQGTTPPPISNSRILPIPYLHTTTLLFSSPQLSKKGLQSSRTVTGTTSLSSLGLLTRIDPTLIPLDFEIIPTNQRLPRTPKSLASNPSQTCLLHAIPYRILLLGDRIPISSFELQFLDFSTRRHRI